MVSSRHRNVRGSNIIIASAAVIALLFLPLTASNNNNAVLQSESFFAQAQGQGTANGSSTATESQSFLTYENPTYGILMQYPSDWTASTSGLGDYTDLIAFYSPLQNLSDSFPARLKISVVSYSQDVSLQEYTNFVWTVLNQSEQQVVDVRSSSEVTVAGNPGYRIVLAEQPFQNSTTTLYHMNTWITIGNKVYVLTYEGEESMFNQHLPQVSRMMESLSIASNNNMTSTAGDG
jgi:hypothetical protein